MSKIGKYTIKLNTRQIGEFLKSSGVAGMVRSAGEDLASTLDSKDKPKVKVETKGTRVIAVVSTNVENSHGLLKGLPAGGASHKYKPKKKRYKKAKR